MRSRQYLTCWKCWTLMDGIVTIDAMGCQKEIARKTVEAGADYVLAVKENQASCTRT